MANKTIGLVPKKRFSKAFCRNGAVGSLMLVAWVWFFRDALTVDTLFASTTVLGITSGIFLNEWLRDIG